MTDALTLAGERALNEARRLWSLDIYDPKRTDHTMRGEFCRAHINAMLRACGWDWEVPYAGDGAVEWCGIFAAACWRSAGIDERWLPQFFPSTMRLNAWARYQNWNEHKNPAPTNGDRRMYAPIAANATGLPFVPRAGDIVIVGDGSPWCGDHITLCERYSPATRTVTTLSGNGGGVGPNGDRRQGVSRADFKVGASSGYRVMFVIRPAFGDLLAERP